MDVEEPILKGEIPYYIMDEVDEAFRATHGLVSIVETSEYPMITRYYWLTEKLILVVETEQQARYYFAYTNPVRVRSVLRVNSLGTLDGLGIEGLLLPEAQDAIKSWMVLARMQQSESNDKRAK